MGLLTTLGLKPRTGSLPPPPGAAGAPSAAAGAPSHAGGTSSDDSDADPVVVQHDIIADMLGSIGDEKLIAGFETELSALRAKHAKAAPAAQKTELASAAVLSEKVKKVAAAVLQKRELSDARADVDAVVQQITALVLGGINDDAARKAINDEFAKLKANIAKAAKIVDPKSAITAYNALLTVANDLRAKADRTKFATDYSQASLQPLIGTAQAGIDRMPAAPKAVMQKELDGLKTDIQRYGAAADSTALQSIVMPRLKKLNDVATTLAKASTQADADLAQAATLIKTIDPATSADLKTRLQALQDQKKTAWPSGNSLDEIAASVDAVTSGAKTLIADAQALKSKNALDAEIAALRKKLDALKPRIAKASEAPVPGFIDQRQKNVQMLANVMDEQLLNSKKPQAEKTLASLQLALDDMERFKGFYAAHQAKLNAAKNGPIKAALALKLMPADLAATRDKTIADREAEIEAMTVNGVFGPADSAIDQWIVESKAWSSAKEAYDDLHSKNPKTGKLEDLAAEPGGGPVLDALVAGMPTDKTPPKAFICAMQARYGVEVEQFEHRKDGGKSEDPDKKTKLDPTKPDPDQEKDLQGLYKVLSKVPVNDVKYVEKINRFTKDKESATYTGGVFTDTIALHCGRPGDPDQTNFNQPGVVLPVGEAPNPDIAPVNPGDSAPWFDFTVLHEVGHAVDDARGIMSGGRAKDAAWDTHGTGAVAEKIAWQCSYDAGYIEHMLDDKASATPKNAPSPPKGIKQTDWDNARIKAENWVKAIRVGNKLWDDAGGSKDHQIAGRVYHEAYEGTWVSYSYAARAQGITGYQFRAPAEWFAELYAAFHCEKLNPKHPATPWLRKLQAESKTAH